jgi:putative transposase
MSVSEKRSCIDPAHQQLSISRQCELITLPRSSFYRPERQGESAENLELMRLIDEEYMRHPFYGARKIRDWLINQGYDVNRKRVQRLMRLMGIASIAPKPNTSKGNIAHKKYPYLLQGLDINHSDQVWCADITYIRMPGGFVYLTAVMDWHSRFVLSWEVSITMDDDFCVSALQSAIRRHGKPEIFNTDQGVQYTGKTFTSVLKENDIRISMDGKGRWMDNVFIERLWRSVKYEEIYIKEYNSVTELVQSLKQYFNFYNFERTASGTGWKDTRRAILRHSGGPEGRII